MLIEIFEKIVANLGEFEVKSCNSKVRVRASTEVATLKVRLLICYLSATYLLTLINYHPQIICQVSLNHFLSGLAFVHRISVLSGHSKLEQ
jgi:hypothetical protein